MTTRMIALVGEQPMPVLLPVRYLKPDETILVHTEKSRDVANRLAGLIPKSDTISIQPYAFESSIEKLKTKVVDDVELVFNLTGGTKMMALAAFALVAQTNSQFVYFQSEGHRSRLSRYNLSQGVTQVVGQEEIPELISATDYLNAHLPGFDETGFHHEKSGELSDGGKFEKTVFNLLKGNANPEFEILSGVRPQGVADQIEIDLVIRCGNHVGIAEVKLGDKEEKKPKQGLDQLAMAGRREYLGTYTTKFLITGRPLRHSKIKTLAQDAGIHIIDLSSDGLYRPLARRDKTRLLQTVTEKLCGYRR